MATRCHCPLSRAISNRTSDVVNDRLRAAIGASRGLGSSAGARPSNEPVNEVQVDALLAEVVMPVLAAAVTTKHPHLLTPGHEFSHDGLLLAADVGAVHDEARTHALSNSCIGVHLRAARKRPGTTEDHERELRHRHVPSTPSGPPRRRRRHRPLKHAHLHNQDHAPKPAQLHHHNGGSGLSPVASAQSCIHSAEGCDTISYMIPNVTAVLGATAGILPALVLALLLEQPLLAALSRSASGLRGSLEGIERHRLGRWLLKALRIYAAGALGLAAARHWDATVLLAGLLGTLSSVCLLVAPESYWHDRDLGWAVVGPHLAVVLLLVVTVATGAVEIFRRAQPPDD